MKKEQPTCKPHQHNWHVFGAHPEKRQLVVVCMTCGEGGAVTDPTDDEWAKAFPVDAEPFPWNDDSRVTPHSQPGPSAVGGK